MNAWIWAARFASEVAYILVSIVGHLNETITTRPIFKLLSQITKAPSSVAPSTYVEVTSELGNFWTK